MQETDFRKQVKESGKTALNNEEGMAYVTILFLLVIISALAMTFIMRTSTGMSEAARRGEGIKAGYLAESAANHALWRLINESDFPADENVYYMHSLAEGRYGYKVKKNTDTTFAAIAAVGVSGSSVVYQSYVLYFKPPEAEGGIIWFTDSDSRVYTPPAGSWEDVDLSGDGEIPDGATGVLVEIINESSNSYKAQVRARGSVNNRTLGSRVKGASQVTAFAMLDDDKVFQAYREHNDIKFYIRGYTGNRVKYFINSPSVNLGPVSGSADSLDFSGEGVPGGSIAILELYNGKDLHVMLRRKGDSNWSAYCQFDPNTHQYVAVGVNSDSIIEYSYNGTFTNNSYSSVNLVGYIKDVGTWLASPTNDVSDNMAGSWRTNDITGETSSRADTAFVNVRYNEYWSGYKFADLRKTGSSDDQYAFGGHMSPDETGIFSVVGLDESQRFDSKVEHWGIDMHLVGYTEPPE